MKNVDIFDLSVVALTTAYSLANIESILGILILAIQLVWVTFKCASKIYEYIKKKADEITTNKYEEVDDVNNKKK